MLAGSVAARRALSRENLRAMPAVRASRVPASRHDSASYFRLTIRGRLSRSTHRPLYPRGRVDAPDALQAILEPLRDPDVFPPVRQTPCSTGAGCEAAQIRSLMPELAPDSVGFYCGSNLVTFPAIEEAGDSPVLTFRRSDVRDCLRYGRCDVPQGSTVPRLTPCRERRTRPHPSGAASNARRGRSSTRPAATRS